MWLLCAVVGGDGKRVSVGLGLSCAVVEVARVVVLVVVDVVMITRWIWLLGGRAARKNSGQVDRGTSATRR